MLGISLKLRAVLIRGLARMLTCRSKSKLRSGQQPSLGPQYSGARVSRGALIPDDESDEDPFGSGASQQDRMSSNGEDDEDVVDPDDVDMDAEDVGGDEDIDSEEAFGDGDEEAFKGFTFGGSRLAHAQAQAPDLQKTGSMKERKHKAPANGASVRTNGEVDDGADSVEEAYNETEEEDDGDEEMTSHDGSATDQMASDSDASIDDGSESDGTDTDEDSTKQTPQTDDRAAVRKMMAEEQTTVVAAISRATKADAAKGRAVMRQRSIFDTLLNTRIRLQKALIVNNSLSTISHSETLQPDPNHDAATATIQAAEAAALTLWNTLSSLRQSLLQHENGPTTTIPASPPPATTSTPLTDLHTALHTLDSTTSPANRATLTKWAQKTHLATSLPTRPRLSAAPTQQPLTAVLDTHLAAPNLDRLIARTRVPRSCAPLQAQAGEVENADIYDDADFYTLLLRDLVEQKMSTSSTSTLGPAAASLGNGGGAKALDLPSLTRISKVRKKVDTKASKGRKMRFTVLEKLQNFMAAEDGGGWEERQVGELFGGLLGRKVRGGLGEGEGDDEIEMDGEEGALRLFGGV